MFIILVLLSGGFILGTVVAVSSGALVLAGVLAVWAIATTWCVLRALPLVISDARAGARTTT